MMVHMDVTGYAARLRRDLWNVGQAGGEEAQAAAERMAGALDSSLRLVLLDAMVEAAGEISEALSPASVEVRLLGRDVQFAVTPAASVPSAPPLPPVAPAAEQAGPADEGDEEGGTARLSLRLPERLKPKVEQAAAAAGLSVNAWLVRSIGALLESPPPPPPVAQTLPPTTSGQRRTGWAR